MIEEQASSVITPTGPRHARPQGASHRAPAFRLPGMATVAHAATLVVAFVYLCYLDRNLWFDGDDWDFVADRGLHHPVRSIWVPHNEHWSTLPILVWRALYTVFGLHTYWPYLLTAVIGHLLLAHVLWRVCRAEGSDPWVATALVTVFLFLGSGGENLTWAFPMTAIGSVLFGWLAVHVARRAGSRRDEAIISALLLAAVMFSAIGNSMVVVAAIVLILRVGWASMVRAVAAPIVIYGVWYVLVGHNAVGQDHITGHTLTALPTYLWTGLSAALGTTVGLSSAGPALLVGLLVWVAWRFPRLRAEHPVVIGVVGGLLTFYLLAGLGRSGLGLAQAGAPRYIYVAVALLVPVLAVLASPAGGLRQAVDVRLPAVGLSALVLLVNLGLLHSFAVTKQANNLAEERLVRATATLLAAGVPDLITHPVVLEPDVTGRQWIGLVRHGQIHPVSVSAIERLTVEGAASVTIGERPLRYGAPTLLGTSQPVGPIDANGCLALPNVGGMAVQVRPTASGAVLRWQGPGSGGLGVSFATSDGTTGAATGIGTPASGHGYISDAITDADLTLVMPAGGANVLCGLAH